MRRFCRFAAAFFSKKQEKAGLTVDNFLSDMI
jgi:hypothetical protein